MEEPKFESQEECPREPLIQEFRPEEWPSRVIEDHLDRRPPTPEEREKMDRELIDLGNLMKDSNVWWQLDGALNISLSEGDYIGVHRDIDVSFLREDIPKLETYLKERGYGLFLFKREGEPGAKKSEKTRDRYLKSPDWLIL